MSKKEGSPILTLICFVIGMNVFIALIKGITTSITDGDFFKGFNESAGWILPVIIVLIFLAIMIFLFGNGKNNSKY